MSADPITGLHRPASAGAIMAGHQPPQAQQRGRDMNKPRGDAGKLLVRDDGCVFGWGELRAASPRMTLYTGPMNKAPRTQEEGLAWLESRQISYLETDPDVFDVDSASKEEILQFAVEEFDTKLDSKKPVEELRKDLRALANRVTTGKTK